MNFAYPWAFLALVPLVAIGWIRWRRRASVAVAYPVLDVAPTRRPWRAWLLFIPPVLQTLAAVGVVCALARPQKEVLATKDVREGIAIMTLLDISSSMQMEMGFEGKRQFLCCGVDEHGKHEAFLSLALFAGMFPEFLTLYVPLSRSGGSVT